jgi:hypothetical protein
VSTLTRTARAWLSDATTEDDSVRVVDIPSGRAIALSSGVMHIVADAIEVSDETDTILAARWICGATSVRVIVADEDERRAQCASCRLAAALPQCPVVYYAWGEDDELLYVGSTIKAHRRIRAHITQTKWWPEVRRLTFDECATEAECRQVEAEAISRRPGSYNRAGVVRDDLAGVISMIDAVQIGGAS